MNQTLVHSFNVGAIECAVLADGSAEYGFDKLQGRFPSIDPEKLRAAALDAGENLDAIQTFYNTLLIRSAETTILVDGGESAARHPTAGRTPAALAELGVAPDDIDIVLITHAHGDHIVGLFLDDGQTPRYPNARHLISQPEWDYWTATDTQTAVWLRLLGAQIGFLTLHEEIATGVWPLFGYGHTPGHICLLIENGGEQIMHGVDLVHSLTQFANPEWSIRFDTDPDLARKTRLSIFDQLAVENLRTLFYHMPFPGLGYVRREGAAFAWEPL